MVSVAVALLVAAAVVLVLFAPQRARTTPLHSVAPPPANELKARPGAPNIVVVVTDDMRTDELRYMPNVRRLLAAHGTSFTRAISPHPLCCPARAEMMTGEYAQNNGVHHNNGAYGGFPALVDPGNNIGAWLQHAGYWTGFVGKYLNAYHGSQRIPGWDLWQAAIGNVYRYHSVTLYGAGTIKGYSATTTTTHADEAIETGHKSGKPFYVVANYLAPHDQIGPGGHPSLPRPDTPYVHACDQLRPVWKDDPAYHRTVVGGLPQLMGHDDRPESFNVKEARARACALKSVDDGVGRIVQQLQDDGELDNTDVVFVSDNGYNMGEHFLHGKNLLTDESLQVPIIIRGPHFPAGLRTSAPASLVDLPATYVQLAHATARRPQDGVSLLKVLKTLKTKKPLRDTLLVQTGDDVDDSSPGFAMRGVTTGRYLYGVDPSNPDVGLLFDRRVDPHAMVNVFADPRYAAVRAELQRRLEALMQCSGATCTRVFGALPEPKKP